VGKRGKGRERERGREGREREAREGREARSVNQVSVKKTRLPKKKQREIKSASL
jgi:hypothetical protein